MTAAEEDHGSEIQRRLERLENATSVRLQDARDIHRREHDAWIEAHLREHERTEAGHSKYHDLQRETSEAVVTGYETRFRLEEKARDEQSIALERRLSLLNEFRETLREQTGSYITRREAQLAHDDLAKSIERMMHETERRFAEDRQRLSDIEKLDYGEKRQRMGVGAAVAIIVASIGLVGTILSIIIIAANFLSSN